MIYLLSIILKRRFDVNSEDRFQEDISNEMAKSIMPADEYIPEYNYCLIINVENIVIMGYDPEDTTKQIEYVCTGEEPFKLGNILDDNHLEEAYVYSGGQRSDFRYYKKLGRLFGYLKSFIIVVLLCVIIYLLWDSGITI